jgi:NAD-dependent deacetylase
MRFPGRPTPVARRGAGTSEDLALRFPRTLLASARRILVLTGAGVSVSAGLPTFRGVGGIYGEDGNSVPDFQHADALPAQLDELWRFWGPLRDQVRDATPTAAHHALAQWQARRGEHGAVITLITTNVDDLHERAGGAVHHLHGNLFRSVCLDADCGGRLDNDVRSDGRPTPCPRCGLRSRPDMVLFGEQVDLDALWQAKRAVRDCEVFLAIGTSSSVYPASGLVRYARDVGAYSILVNPAHDTGAGFDQHVALPADVAVPALLAPLP